MKTLMSDRCDHCQHMEALQDILKGRDSEITRLRAALEAFPLLPNVPMAEIDKATLLHKVYRWANGPRKQALGEVE